MDLVDPPQAVEVLVEQHHLGLHAGRDPGCVPADVAGTEHDDFRGTHAGRSAHQDAAPSVVPFQVVGARLRRQASGDLAHRGQEWERPVGGLHGLVRDPGGARLDQRRTDGRIRREVEEREQREVGP